MRQAGEYPGIPLLRRLLDQSATFVATGGYSGYARIVPGTVGSLVGLLLYLPAAASPIAARLTAVVVVFFLGVFASTRVATIWRIKDPHPIVIDEIVGMWISLLFVPFELVYFFGAFVVFRLFDIVKPFPARQAEWLMGGWGIMLDDVAAGVYANLVIQCVVRLPSLLGY
jgi:phosphatidylglycerophosphatase A